MRMLHKIREKPSSANTAHPGLGGTALNTGAILIILLTGVGPLYTVETPATKISVRTIKAASRICPVSQNAIKDDRLISRYEIKVLSLVYSRTII